MIRKKMSFVRGDDVEYQLTLVGEIYRDALKTGTLTMTARDWDSDEVVFTLSSGNGIKVYDDSSVIIYVDHGKTAKAEWTTANYDIELVDAQGKHTTLVIGTIKLIQDYSRG